MTDTVFLRRPNIFPKKLSDYPLFVFLLFMIPLTYWFEVWVVLPALFSDRPVIYFTLFFLGHFILHNVIGNFMAMLMYDTSIRGRSMPAENQEGVNYCSICNTSTPPRSFHCPSCDVCILKRDHHCIFTGCCVGFYNHRFFFYLIFYMMMATIISFPLNLYFLKDSISLSEPNLIIAIVCPVTLLFFDFGTEQFEVKQFYLILAFVGLLGLIFCSVWFYFHLKLVLKGMVVHELRKCINIYNLGQESNVKMVFGTRWKLTWISPYVSSPLPCDGTSFPQSQDDKTK